jgi:signal peptidase I
MRWLLETTVLLAIAVGFANTFLLEGWFVPEVVSSGSMAPALLGPHRVCRCEVCGFDFACDADEGAEEPVVCPNCGWPRNRLEPRVIAGDRLLLDRATLGARPVRRWDEIVFRLPDQASEYAVKRVVGLPGETIAIRDGAVIVDATIARRTLEQQRAQAILVHDSAHWPADPRLPPRWRPDSGGGWHTTPDGGFRRSNIAAATSGELPVDWLSYVHWRRRAYDPMAIEEAPIRDLDTYNPSTSRRLNDVADLMLVARLSTAGSGELLLRVPRDGERSFEVVLRPAVGQVILKQDDTPLARVELGRPILNQSAELTVSTFDQQVLVAIDGTTELEFAFDRPAGPLQMTARSFAIGARDLRIDVHRLMVWHNVYYTPARVPQGAGPRRLGPDEFFVLGDNSPVSVDSRMWTGQETVTGRMFFGRPVVRWRREL